MGRFEANLPEVLVPEGEICVNVRIPNHPDYVKLFVRAMRMLEVNRMYERDEEHSAKVVCEQWRTRTLTPLIEALATGNGCPEDTAEYDCIEYPAFASFIEYVPLSPFQAGAEVPPNYLTYPWWKWSKLDTVLPDWIDNPIADFIENLTQYQPNDAITWLGGLPYWGIGEIIDNSFPFPYIKIHVTGKGSIRMNFLSFPLGGRIMTEVDEIPNIIDILTSSFIDPDSRVIDTDRDVTTFPMEQWPVIGVKMEIEEEGDHIVYCMMLPKVEAGLDFFGFGGGLRSVELCNGLRPINTPEPEPPPLLEGVEELRPEFQFTAECGLEYRLRDQENNIVQDWQAVAGWDENFAACVTGGLEMPTQQEITEAIVDAFEIQAARFLAGEGGNIQGGVTINPDGTVTVGGAGSLPSDDPATPINENEASYYGGISEIAAKLEAVLDKIDALYGATNDTGGLTQESAAQIIMKDYYPSDAALMDAAVTAYYTYRIQNNMLSFDRTASSNAFPLYLYCNGYSINTLARYLGDVSGFPFSKQQTIKGLWNALSDAFFSDFFAIGIQVLNNGYVDAACHPMPYQEFSDVPYASVRNLSPVTAKGGHRLKIRVSGHYVDPDGDLQDAFWYKTAAGVLTRSNFTFSHAAGSNMPSDNQVPYNESHVYEYTIDLSTGNSSWSVTFNRNAGMAVSSTSPTNGFDIKITDLGLAVSA